MATPRPPKRARPIADLPGGDPLWYKDAVIYELHVRAFSDSNGDGIGDFAGLTQRLDYLQDLGVTAIWLLPFYPSPLRDDGYDIADYTGVHPSYGSLADVRQLVRAAHRRGLRVITELVCNHTSDQHPWFQRARRARPGSTARGYYVFSDTAAAYRDARIIFKDFERSNWTWDPVAGAYYWHRFFSHQPDLNFEHPAVRKSLLRVLDFWLNLGIDGLRLDAVPYLYEREGTSCENLPETHAFLKELRRHVDDRFRSRLLLAEANQWPEEAVPYFGQGDECHMAFHFPLMPRLFMAIHMEDRYPILEILRQTPAIPDSCQWALFLRNHDELTLEMVTDEERDYMYRVYAQDPKARINLGIRRRLAPLLGNHRRKIELMNGLLFSLPGTPVIYYGDEIGMGDNIYLGDRDGVRTPMQWSADRNAGFSRANPQRLYLPIIIDPEYHYEAVNVEAQQNNQHSLLWWMKRLIALRRRYKSFGRGSLTFLQPDNAKVLAYLRQHDDERLLIVANLSRFPQYAALDLHAHAGQIPVELFGRVDFPPIRPDQPYLLTLGPHSFLWFSLERPRQASAITADRPLPELAASSWPFPDAPDARARVALAALLPDYLPRCRWFGSKARRIKAAHVTEALQIPDAAAWLLLVRVEYTDGTPEQYVVPLALAQGAAAEAHLADGLCRVRLGPDTDDPTSPLAAEAAGRPPMGVLYDPLAAPLDAEFAARLLQVLLSRRRLSGLCGEAQAGPARALRGLPGPDEVLPPAAVRGEQSNASIAYGDRVMLKLLRRVEPGPHPETEILRFLNRRGFAHAPLLGPTLEYQADRAEPITLALVQGFVTSEGVAWRHAQDALSQFFDRALALPPGAVAAAGGGAPLSVPWLLDHSAVDSAQRSGAPSIEAPAPLREVLGSYLAAARLLGQRTAELHHALRGDADDPVFAPEPFTPFYQRSIYQSMRSQAEHSLRILRAGLSALPADALVPAQQVLDREPTLQAIFRRVTEHPITTQRIRHHGDLHLGQVLYTGADFVFIDFEGEPARPLSERRLKRSPLRDVAGIIRSFHYAAQAALLTMRLSAPKDGDAAAGAAQNRPPAGGHAARSGRIRDEDLPRLQQWADLFYGWSSASFLGAYLAACGAGGPDSPSGTRAEFVPAARAELEVLLGAFLLEKAVYELAYELNNRPAWVKIPLDGILLLSQSP